MYFKLLNLFDKLRLVYVYYREDENFIYSLILTKFFNIYKDYDLFQIFCVASYHLKTKEKKIALNAFFLQMVEDSKKYGISKNRRK